MKVLFVSSGNSIKGISPIIYRQGQSLVSKNISLDYFSIDGKGLRGYINAISKLKKTLRTGNYSIVHAHYALCGFVTFFASKKEKLVLSFMGDDLLGTNLRSGSVSTLSRIMAFFNKYLAKWFFNVVIVKSPQMLKTYGVDKKVHVIPNGVDIDLFIQKEKNEAQKVVGFNSGKKHIIFLADPKRAEKNFDLAQSAYNLLPKDKFEMHTIYNASVDQLVNYYNAADVLIMTSFHEGSPNVVKEAMACGCPIVCTNVGDVEKLFATTKGCYLTSYNAKEISDLLLKAIEFRNENKFTGGRQRIKELKLDSEAVAETIINLYRSIKIS